MKPLATSTRSSKRSSASERPKTDKPGFRLTPRDGDIIETVWRYRALTTPQIAALFFPTEDQAVSSQCLARLRHLVKAGYLDRREQPQVRSDGRKPSLYFLNKEGATFLVEELGVEPQTLDWKPTDNNVTWIFLSHLLATNDFRVAVSRVTRAHGWTIETWLDDHTLQKVGKDYVELSDDEGRRRRAAVVPDGYFVLSDGTYLYHHFLELDRGTVTGDAARWEKRDWARKVQIYLEYYRSGQFQRRYQTRSYRILTVTTSRARLATLKRITEVAGGRTRFWFTTMDQVSPETVLTKPIWEAATSEDRHSLVW